MYQWGDWEKHWNGVWSTDYDCDGAMHGDTIAIDCESGLIQKAIGYEFMRPTGWRQPRDNDERKVRDLRCANP